jgi:hypothetical protein
MAGSTALRLRGDDRLIVIVRANGRRIEREFRWGPFEKQLMQSNIFCSLQLCLPG